MTKLLKGVAAALRRLTRPRSVDHPGPAGPVHGRPTGHPRTGHPTRVPAEPPPEPDRSAARQGVHRDGPPGGRHLQYAPQPDGEADPGEIVWTWVAYEDDPSQGKDRPVLVVGRDGRTLLGLMLSSRHERDGQRHWLALGRGDWDRESRPSWIRLDRVLHVDETRVRREGAVLDRTRFEAVAARLRDGYGWG